MGSYVRGVAIADATQFAFRSNAKFHRSVQNLVGKMDQMFRCHRESRIASVGGQGDQQFGQAQRQSAPSSGCIGQHAVVPNSGITMRPRFVMACRSHIHVGITALLTRVGFCLSAAAGLGGCTRKTCASARETMGSSSVPGFRELLTHGAPSKCREANGRMTD